MSFLKFEHFISQNGIHITSNVQVHIEWVTGDTSLDVVRELQIIRIAYREPQKSMSILEINGIFDVLEKGEEGVNIVF